MDLFRHHAYVLAGDAATTIAHAHRLLADAGVLLAGNPDMLTISVHALSIDDARTIFERTRTSVPQDSRRIVLISCMQATVEAQNALLKLTEEPGERTHFFFIVPNEDVLTATLRSRLQSLTSLESGEEIAHQADAFLKASFSKRMESLADCIEEKKHEQAIALLDDIERRLASDAARYARALRAVETTRSYVLRRGSSLKLVLEFVALSVPCIA